GVDGIAALELPDLAAAVEQADVLVAVDLEVPVGVRGEPVVVAAVADDGVVVRDAQPAEQGLELLLGDEVATYRVTQVTGPVDLDRALDVVLVVGRGVFVDLDQNDLGVVEMLLDPVGRDESGLATHEATPVVGLG